MYNKSIYATLFPYLKQDVGNDLPSQGGIMGTQNTPYTIPPDDTPAPPVNRETNNPSVPIMGGGQAEDAGVKNPYTPSPGMDDVAPLINAIIKKNNPNYEMSDLDKAKQNYTTALSAPIQHQNPYLNALFVGLQGANKFFHPNDQTPVTPLAEAKHNMQVQKAYQQYAPLEAIEAQKGKAAQEQSEADLKKAQVDWYKQRPGIEEKKIQGQSDRQAQGQINKIKLIQERDALQNKHYKIDTDPTDGHLIKKYPDHQEDFTDENGDKVYNLLKQPVAKQIEDGLNPDGSKRYKTVYVTGAQDLSNDSVTKYRDAMLSLEGGRLEESTRHNKVGEQHQTDELNFRKQQAKDANSHFEASLKLRQDALNDARDARAKGDTRAEQAANDRVKAAELRIINSQMALDKTHKNLEIDDADYNDLNERINKLGIPKTQ